MEISLQRKNEIKRVNSLKDLEKYKKKSEINRKIRISLKHKYVYFNVGKNANSTIKYYLQQIEVIGTHLKIDDVHDLLKSPHVSPYQLSEEQLIDILNDSDFKKIAFVRNPFSRLLSCYLNIVKFKKWVTRKLLYSLLNKPIESEITFEEFIDFICEQEAIDMDEHWRIQYCDIVYPLIDFSFIGKVENLNYDLNFLIDFLFKDVQIKNRWKIWQKEGLLNQSPIIQNSQKKLMDFYNENLATKVYEKYILDFETFGYSSRLEDIHESINRK